MSTKETMSRRRSSMHSEKGVSFVLRPYGQKTVVGWRIQNNGLHAARRDTSIKRTCGNMERREDDDKT